MPPGLSARDIKILKSVKRRAHYLDKGFAICGLRFGWTFLIGMVPGAGDVADVMLNYFLVVRKARQAEIPGWLLRQMLMNNAVSAGVGFVPLLGDVVMAAFKANSRNAALLEEFLRIRGEEFVKLEGGNVTNNGGGKKLKGKGVSKHDAEQVLPGAGREQGEAMSSVIPGGLAPVNAVTPTSGGSKSTTPNSGKSRKGFGWLSGKSKAPSPGEKGRFVENVDGTTVKK